MRRLLATLLLLVPFVSFIFCQDTALIDAQTLLNAERNISCADFIRARANSVCCNYTTKNNVEKEYFFQLFPSDENFVGAQSKCAAQGGFLASIRDEDDINKILGLMANGTTALVGYSRQTDGNYKNVDWVSQNFKAPVVPVVGDAAFDCVSIDKDTNATTRANCTAQTHYVCRFNYLDNAIIQISTERKTWHKADETCQGIGGQLVSMQNAAQKRVINCLLVERNKHFAWTGLNDLTKELHFRWADYSLSKFQPFCKTPTSDTAKDCVAILTRSHPEEVKSGKNNANDVGHGCLKPAECGTGHPYVCMIKNPGCDAGTNRFRDYITTILSDATQANSVCGGSCKFGGKGGKGLANHFKHRRVPGRRKKTKVVKKVTKGKRGKKRTKTTSGFISSAKSLSSLF